MSSVPPTVADLDAEVSQRCGLAVADVGLFFRAVDGANNPITPAIRQGLRKGAKAVGLTLADPLNLQDSDVATLSSFAMERVLDEGELFALQQVLAHWWRATQGEQERLSPNPMLGGWRAEEKAAVRSRVAELKARCEVPYREPSDPTVVINSRPTGGYWPDGRHGPGSWDGYYPGWGEGGWR